MFKKNRRITFYEYEPVENNYRTLRLIMQQNTKICLSWNNEDNESNNRLAAASFFDTREARLGGQIT